MLYGGFVIYLFLLDRMCRMNADYEGVEVVNPPPPPPDVTRDNCSDVQWLRLTTELVNLHLGILNFSFR